MSPFFLTIFKDKKLIFALLGLVIIGGLIASFGPEDSLDAKLYYSGNEASLFFSSLSEAAVQKYKNQEVLDLFFIFFYTTIFYRLLRLRKPERAFLLCLIPGILDYSETLSILYYLLNAQSPIPLNWLGYVTFLKWFSGFLLSLYIAFILVTGPLRQSR